MPGASVRDFVIPGLALVMLVPMGLVNAKRTTVADTQPYHARVRDAANAIPRTIGGWQSEEIGLPEFALNLLKPNVIVHRRYTDPNAKRFAQLTFVHSKDARWLIDHYPPSCYPSFGWIFLAEEKEQWHTNWLPEGKMIPGAEFGFKSRNSVKENPDIVVRNFIMLHQHGMHRDHEPVHVAAADFTRRLYGAAQLSVMMDASIPRVDRDAIYSAILEAVGHAVKTVLDEGAAPTTP